MTKKASGETSDLPRGIGRPATSALEVVGVTRLKQLTRWTEKDLLALHGVGPKAVRVLREALAERGLSFKQGQ
jgi:predicted flap endonuclease-1-like 5' DNA nuclease